MLRGDADEANMAAVLAFVSTVPRSGPVNEPFINVLDALSDLIVVFSAYRLPPSYVLPVLANSDPGSRYFFLSHCLQALRVLVHFLPVRYPFLGM